MYETSILESLIVYINLNTLFLAIVIQLLTSLHRHMSRKKSRRSKTRKKRTRKRKISQAHQLD